MSGTILTPQSMPGMALLVIDVQQELFAKSTPIYHAETLLDNICVLIERAHQAGAPVFFIQHTNQGVLAKDTPGWQLHPRLVPQDVDIVMEKNHGSAFEKTDLQKTLQAKNVGTLVITGLVTHGCIKAACLDAHRLGYRVILVEDGHSNYHKQAGAVIAEWNQKLGTEAAEVIPAGEVDFK